VVRTIDKRQELAVRAALGSGWWRLAAQPLGESLALGAISAVGALVIAWSALRVLVPLLPASFFRAHEARLSAAAVGVTALAALLAALLFALAPVLWITRHRPALRLGSARSHGGGPAVRRLLDASVVAQVGLTTVLLLGAGMLVRSYGRLAAVDPGFATERVLTFAVPLLGDRFAEVTAVHALFERLVERVEGLPGVRAAAGVLLRPLQGPDGYDARYTLDDRPADQAGALPLLQLEAVTPHFFAAMGIPVEEGRLLTAADREGAPQVVAISRTVADRLWPGESAVGKVLRWGGSLADGQPVTVVGVTGPGRYHSLARESLNVYIPYRQHSWPMQYVVVGTDTEPAALLPALRAAIREIEPGLQPVDVATTGELKARALARPRFLALLLGTLAVLATLVGALGLHGVLAYVVALRRREVGIRLALGARPRQAARMVFTRAARLAAGGVAGGLLAGWAIASALRGVLGAELYGVGWADPLVFLAVAAIVGVLAAAAASAPAAGASRVAAAEVLRG
jgi:putative ABC transport system permease protein